MLMVCLAFTMVLTACSPACVEITNPLLQQQYDALLTEYGALQGENARLINENELLKNENELLKNENELLTNELNAYESGEKIRYNAVMHRESDAWIKYGISDMFEDTQIDPENDVFVPPRSGKNLSD